MKRLIGFSLFLLLFSCDINQLAGFKDLEPYVAKEIDDLRFEEGIKTYQIDITEVFADDDNYPEEMLKTLESNSNPSLLTAELVNETLTITFTEFETGEAELLLQVQTNDLIAQELFKIVITANKTDSVVNVGAQFFTDGNYAEAETAFAEAVTLADPRFLATAYTGLGFAQIRTGNHEDAYKNLSSGLSQPINLVVNDTKSGLTFLEFSLNSNFLQSLSLGLDVLQADAAYTMTWDPNVDHRDVRLTVAQDYYFLNQYSESLAHAKILDSSFTLSESDPDFQQKLLTKLRQLADELNE